VRVGLDETGDQDALDIVEGGCALGSERGDLGSVTDGDDALVENEDSVSPRTVGGRG
jgi:hypothetical protein